MQDMFFIVVFMFTLAFCMRKHGTWKPVDGLGGFLGWFFVSFILFGLTRGMYLIAMIVISNHSLQFPLAGYPSWFYPISAVLAIATWFAMMYWRIPMRLLGRK